MTPTKRLGGAVSRDFSPDAALVGDQVVNPLAAAGQPDSADEEMIAVPLLMDNLPDLPSIVQPSSASDVAQQHDAEEPAEVPMEGQPSAQHGMDQEVMNDEQTCSLHDLQSPITEPVPDHVPEPSPDPAVCALPDAIDEVMIDQPGQSLPHYVTRGLCICAKLIDWPHAHMHLNRCPHSASVQNRFILTLKQMHHPPKPKLMTPLLQTAKTLKMVETASKRSLTSCKPPSASRANTGLQLVLWAQGCIASEIFLSFERMGTKVQPRLRIRTSGNS